MTRILVCGTIDDTTFVNAKLNEVNRTYGPVSCVIHGNHSAALAWQQSMSRGTHPVKQRPITGKLAQSARDAMLAAKPAYVIVFQTAGPGGRDPGIQKLVYQALREGLIVLTYEPEPVCRTRGRPASPRLDIMAAA